MNAAPKISVVPGHPSVLTQRARSRAPARAATGPTAEPKNVLVRSWSTNTVVFIHLPKIVQQQQQ